MGPVGRKGDEMKYRVTLNVLDDCNEAFSLGIWEGLAETEEEAERKAMDELWDQRLDGTCCPSCIVEEIDDDGDGE